VVSQPTTPVLYEALKRCLGIVSAIAVWTYTMWWTAGVVLFGGFHDGLAGPPNYWLDAVFAVWFVLNMMAGHLFWIRHFTLGLIVLAVANVPTLPILFMMMCDFLAT